MKIKNYSQKILIILAVCFFLTQALAYSFRFNILNFRFNSGLITNGDFYQGLLGWNGSLGTWNANEQNVTIITCQSACTTAGNTYFRQNITTQIGKTYTVKVQVVSISGTGQFGIYAVRSTDDPRNGTYLGPITVVTTANGSGVYTYTFTAATTTSTIVLANEVQNNQVTKVDNISVF